MRERIAIPLIVLLVILDVFLVQAAIKHVSQPPPTGSHSSPVIR